MGIIIKWIINAIAIYLTATIVPGVEVVDLLSALMVAVILGLINTFIKPILMLLTLPITLLTFGLFALVLNALFIMLVGQIVTEFSVAGFVPALLFSIVLTIINWMLNILVK